VPGAKLIIIRKSRLDGDADGDGDAEDEESDI